MQEMQVVTKAAFSRLLRVSKPRVSQYVGMGMPVRADGRLDLPVAMRWVRENIGPTCPAGADNVLSPEDLERILDG
jgi:phage terminase Nu1 subunit (DNA packaging protein)